MSFLYMSQYYKQICISFVFIRFIYANTYIYISISVYIWIECTHYMHVHTLYMHVHRHTHTHTHGIKLQIIYKNKKCRFLIKPIQSMPSSLQNPALGKNDKDINKRVGRSMGKNDINLGITTFSSAWQFRATDIIEGIVLNGWLHLTVV